MPRQPPAAEKPERLTPAEWRARGVHRIGGLQCVSTEKHGDCVVDHVAPEPPAWTDKKPTVEGRYAYLRYPDVKLGDVRRIFLDSDGELRMDCGCAGDLPLDACEDGLWLKLPEPPADGGAR